MLSEYTDPGLLLLLPLPHHAEAATLLEQQALGGRHSYLNMYCLEKKTLLWNLLKNEEALSKGES